MFASENTIKLFNCNVSHIQYPVSEDVFVKWPEDTDLSVLDDNNGGSSLIMFAQVSDES